MTGRPVNIADFRCRSRKTRTTYFSVRDANRSHGLKVVESSNSDQDAVEYLSQENPGVFDIGIAREVQRLHHRAVRPISIHLRRGKVIRFGEAPARAVAGMRAPAAWPVSHDGPYDLPPAA